MKKKRLSKKNLAKLVTERLTGWREESVTISGVTITIRSRIDNDGCVPCLTGFRLPRGRKS